MPDTDMPDNNQLSTVKSPFNITPPNDPIDLSDAGENVARLAVASRFAFEVWQQKTAIVRAFLQNYPLNATLTRQQIADLIDDYTLDEMMQPAEEVEVMRGLRQLRELLMVRWIWQDALGLISLEQLTDELSDFADACLNFAKGYTWQNLVKRYGKPRYRNEKGEWVDDDMAIFAMGKLGARELNLSSDIDLIFVHQARGETTGSRENGTKCIDSKRFMTRLGQGIIKLLDENTADGFVFRWTCVRVLGAMAIHLSALEKYFAKHGRAWERLRGSKLEWSILLMTFAKQLTESVCLSLLRRLQCVFCVKGNENPDPKSRVTLTLTTSSLGQAFGMWNLWCRRFSSFMVRLPARKVA